jgi:hypothetical protein
MHTTTRLEIPHSDVHDCAIVGVLEQYDVSADAVVSDRRPIALVRQAFLWPLGRP